MCRPPPILCQVEYIETAMAVVGGSGRSWSLASKDWDGGLAEGDTLSLRFIVLYTQAEKPFPTDISFNDEVRPWPA